ncbi:MAG: HAD hydrolase family protein [Ruminococcus sp.]|nr:HAD hydrolase family protein [Ruminococcus sp.]
MKSAIAVGLCMLVYFARTLLPIGNGIPFYGALAALWCIQPYNNTTKNNAVQRSMGTLIGAVYGLLFLLLFRLINVTVPMIVYISASAVIIPVIYTTVVLNKRNASFFSCVVFLSIALTHSFDSDPYLFVLNRVIDTFIGIIIGVAVNDFRLPIKHDTDNLYVSGIDDVLISQTSNYNKVELNRLIRSGVKFTISTVRTPAVLMDIMKGVELRLPVIVMDGAALYDIKQKEYIEAEYLPAQISEKAEQIIAHNGSHCFVNVMYDSTLLIFYGGFTNPAEKELFDSFKHSPYRNYIRASFRRRDENERILYLTVLETAERAKALKDELTAQLGGQVRVTAAESGFDGYEYVRVYSPRASKSEMLKKLKAHTGIEKTVTFGSIKGEYDVYIGDGGGNTTVKKLKKLYRGDVYH